jgi:16S rRNA (cytidine1402-2'-O)-methyltransferase
MLYIVATPIGNLEDITKRALKVLEKVDFILAEDTRRTGLLLKHYNLPKKHFLSLHQYNEQRRIQKITGLLKQGKSVALVSNAGTPCISDPGYKLVRACVRENIKVTSIPGPCSIINALVLSGLPTDSFLFLGFLPRKKGALKKRLESAKLLKTTLVIFESPYRLVGLLQDLKEILGPKTFCAVIREMTKIYEEVKVGQVDELINCFKDRKLKGEIIVILDNR